MELLRMHDYAVFETYKDRLPELWRKGDLEGYGQVVFASGKSSIENYECGCDELKKLYEIWSIPRESTAVVFSAPDSRAVAWH